MQEEGRHLNQRTGAEDIQICDFTLVVSVITRDGGLITKGVLISHVSQSKSPGQHGGEGEESSLVVSRHARPVR